MCSAVRRVRREVVDGMRMLMKAAKDKKSDGMFAIIEEMLRKTKCLCNLLDQNIVEEVFTFLEDNKVTLSTCSSHVFTNPEFSICCCFFENRNDFSIKKSVLSTFYNLLWFLNENQFKIEFTVFYTRQITPIKIHRICIKKT